MFYRFSRLVLICVCLIAVEGIAFSAITTGRIGGSKGLVVTPVEDRIAALIDILNDPNASLSNSSLEGLYLDFGAFGDLPLESFELVFLKQHLTGVDIGTSNASLQEAMDTRLSDNTTACPSGDCSRASADWMHEQISDTAASPHYNQWSMITASLLDTLIDIDGYTESVLAANDATIADIQSDLFFRGISNLAGASDLPNTVAIKNRINHAGGFVTAAAGGTTEDDGDYTTAQSVVNEFRDNNDRTNFTAATFTQCFTNTETDRSGGEDRCTVTASFWANQSVILTNFGSLKSDLADNTTLTVAQLEDLDLDISALGSPVRSWQLEYLSSILDQNAGTISVWQNTISTFSMQDAALWKIGQIASGASGHAASDMTPLLMDTAIGDNFDSQSLMAIGSSASAPNFAGDSGFVNLSPPNNTATNVKAQLLTYIGFTDDQYTAWVGNPYRSTFTATTFNNCYASTDALTGSGNACSISLSQWNAIQTLVTAVSDNQSSSVTETAINDLYAIDNASYTINLGDAVNMSYVQNCLFALDPVHSGNIRTCVGNATGQMAAKWKIYQISLGQDNTTHPLTDLTVSLYDRAVNTNSGFLQTLFNANPTYTLTNLQSALRPYFTNNALTDQSSDDAFKLFPVSRVGFRDSLTSYNNWLNNAGFSVSAVDNSSENIVRVWEACRRSLDNMSGGTGLCAPTYAQWKVNAENRASNNIIQTRVNDAFLGVDTGPRVYTETLMGIRINLRDVSTRDSTVWQWTDQYGNSQSSTHGWVSDNGHYSFWSTSLANSPPIGSLLTRQ